MHFPTLKPSKLRPPAIPTAAISRPQLLQMLREAADSGCLFSLLSTPVGYGKSILMAQYAASLRTSWAWLRCDSGDNRPLNLLLHLHQAIGLAMPVPAMSAANEETLWTAIIGGIEKRNTAYTLFIDDLHCLRAPAACRYFDELLHHAPENLHIVAASEGLPALRLSHLRRDGRLQLLDTHRFAVDSSEIKTLASAREMKLSDEAAYLLRANSEGWISSVLLGLSAQTEQPPAPSSGTQISAATAQRFHALIAQFFNEEVLGPLPHEMLRFLEQLSVVNSFNVELATCLTGRSDAATLLDRCVRKHLFVQQCDDELEQYRLHKQLQQALYQQLRRRSPGTLTHLHQKAGEHLLQKQSYAEAVYQLGRAQDFDALLAAIDRHSFDLLREGQVNAMVDFLADVPGQNLEDHFTLAITEASTVIVTNDIDRAAACLRRLQRLLRDQKTPEQRDERSHQTFAFLRSRLAFLGGNFDHGIALVDEAMRRYPQMNAATTVLLFNRASALFSLGHLHRARHDTQLALCELTALNFSGYTHLLHLQLGMIELAQGQLLKAEERFTQLIQNRATGASHGFYDLFQYLGKGVLLLQQNKLQSAAEHLAHAKTIAFDFTHSAGLPWVLHYQALCLAAQGRLSCARERWDEARKLARQLKLFTLYRLAGASRARLAVREHDQVFIDEWLKEWRLCNRLYDTNLMPEEWQAYAWVQRHLGQRASAKSISNHLWTRAIAENNFQLGIDLHLLDASLYLDAANHTAALRSLDSALQQAAKHGFAHLLHLEGRQLLELFRQLISPQIRRQHGIEAPLPSRVQLAELLRGLTPESHTSQPLLDPLTRREQDVLQRMVNCQSNQQIADSLYISLSTVKSHINNLFRKLDVVDRKGALQVARESKLFN